MQENCKVKEDTHCPIHNALGDTESIKQWIKDMQDTKVTVAQIDSAIAKRPKTSAGQWISIIVASIIFVGGVIYAAGIQGKNIDINAEHIDANKTQITEVANSIHTTDEKLIELREVVIELRTMAKDISEIKLYLLDQLTKDG